MSFTKDVVHRRSAAVGVVPQPYPKPYELENAAKIRLEKQAIEILAQWHYNPPFNGKHVPTLMQLYVAGFLHARKLENPRYLGRKIEESVTAFFDTDPLPQLRRSDSRTKVMRIKKLRFKKRQSYRPCTISNL